MQLVQKDRVVARSVNDYHPFIARLRLFLLLSEEDVSCLWRLVEAASNVSKRRELVVDGNAFQKLCFIESGFAARYKLLRNGKRQILNVLLPGDIVGLPGSFLEKACYSVIALTDMRLQVCDMREYVRLSYERPQFALALTWLAVQESIICAERAISNGRRTPPERLAHLLLEIHGRLKAVGLAADDSFDLPLSQEVMSDLLGLSVPHLNRTLAKLCNEGLLKRVGQRIHLMNIEDLEILAQFESAALLAVPRF